jgi:DNA-directed RNA polymerase beta' subunit
LATTNDDDNNNNNNAMTSLNNGGPSNLNQSVIRHSPSSVSFGVYTDDEVRQRSVCEITSSVTYDALRNPLPRGLYDPLLGPTSSYDNSCCVTCGQVQSLCPGHFGHVELCVPVMHPLFFSKLLALLRMKCLACHEFRLSRRMCRIYAAKLHLIDGGRLGEAMGLDEELSSAARRETDDIGSADGRGGGGAIDAETKREMALVSARAMDAILDVKLASSSLSSSSYSSSPSGDDDDGLEGSGVVLTLHERSARRQVLKDFQSSCAKALKCANCSAFSPKVRHDQFNKMFMSPLSARNRRSNMAERVRIRSACGTLGGEVEMDDEYDDMNDDRMAVDSEDEVDDEEDANDENDVVGRVVNDEAAEAVVGSRDGSSRASRRNKADVSTSKVADGGESRMKQDNFMNTLEVEAQARLTWERQPFLCSKFFGSAHSPTTADVGDGGVATAGGRRRVDRDVHDAIDDSSECDDSAYVTEEEDAGGGVAPSSSCHRRRARSNSTSNAERALGMGGQGYTIFFLRVLPVPPSRFRPPVVVGNMTVEHSQNYYLSRVIELNAQLRTLFNVTLELTREESALQGSGATLDLNSSGGGGGGRQLRRVRDERERTQANSLRIWVDMQTTVNCFMDSTRDPKGTASAVPNGIRQLLEKKEGIFRKHMMGKRVNFACRSVISPDPYIGTNEIGLPLHFARTLTFPTPVTGLNVAEMRELVRRGPAEYPGAVWVEFPNGQRVDLSKMKERGRNAIAARLLSSGGGGGMGTVKVGRQLKDGDMVLMNRQVRV